ncbi:PqiC family protein [Halomonas icarae]|uniref:ABC-type transport auxiliary lipoprotein component domain-containing protein n=1 Tax=Halomonas icarae TaxID=2691040 RepID=A0A7X4VXK5_9GAMM|nr:ABC-type transport auxiliary lipoprotein family protein [Halomonas icarae]MDR5902245.1 ABC-type transport auxiliary lipoprotein family protein [Halomonas icarae]NAW12055.1 hypothetical protein [Halomonas icarae]
MMARRWIGAALAILLLAGTLGGCASSKPAPERYTLPAATMPEATMPEATRQGAAGAETRYQLQVATPRLADYLDVEGIVMQIDDITLVEARGHQWAEALGKQLQRGLRDRLAQRLPDTRVLLDGTAPREANSLRLALEIDRFQGRHDGRAVIGGRWRLHAADGSLLAMQPLVLENALEADGYPALVRALGRGWDSAADELAEAVRGTRRQE